MSEGNVYVIKSKQADNFTILRSEELADKRLSWKARGLLAYMLSMPTDWKFYDSELVDHSENEGIKVVQSAMKELKELGYVKKVAVRDESNKIKEWVTHVSDTPCFLEKSQISPFVQCGKGTIYKNQNVENGQLLSTNNTKNLNIQSTNNTKNIRSFDNDQVLTWFNEFWKVYPRKIGKENARKAFIKMIKQHDYLTIVKGAIGYANYVKAKGTEPSYIKHASTFLNQKGFEDDYEELLKEELSTRKQHNQPYKQPAFNARNNFTHPEEEELPF